MNAFPGIVVPASFESFLEALPRVLACAVVAVWVFRRLSRWLAAGWSDEEARWWLKGLAFGLGFGLIFVVTCIPLTDWGIEQIGITDRVRQSAKDPRVGHPPTFLAMTSGLWAILVLGITQFRRPDEYPALNCRTRICIGLGIGLGTGIAEAALAHLFGGGVPGQIPLHLLGVAMDMVGCGVAAMFVSPLPEKSPEKLFIGPVWRTLPVWVVCLLPYFLFGVPGGLVVLVLGTVILSGCLDDTHLP